MAECELECADVLDTRRFREYVAQVLAALLSSTATTDTEINILYDVQQNGTYVAFLQWIKVECDGAVVITNTELDGTTEYTITGTVVAEPPILNNTVNAVSHFANVIGDTTIAAGFIQAAISIETGTATVGGVSFPEGSEIELPPMSFGITDRLYPALAITGVTGNVLVYYTTVS